MLGGTVLSKMIDGTVMEVLLWFFIALIGLLEIVRVILAVTFASHWQDYRSILGQVYENMRGESWKISRQHVHHRRHENTEPNVKAIPLLSEEQVELIRARKWKEVLAWIAFHPNELLRVDRKNCTALHFACLVQAPVQVIEMMLFQAPALAFIRNEDNELPLHWAVRLSASKEIIKWLLIVNPASGCEARDKDGNTPLSLTWERHEHALMNAWWSHRRDTIPEVPGWQRVLFFLKAYERSREMRSCTMSMDNDELDNPEELTAHLSDPLHLVCRCASCPISLFTFLLALHRDSLQQRDKQGFLPLHNACLDYQSNRSIGALTKIDLLLNECPEAAAEVEDACGRLPIFVALEGGISWEEGILRLIEAFPKSLQATDPATQLPAFALAAVGPREDEDEISPRQASLTFNLLRKDPTFFAEKRR